MPNPPSKSQEGIGLILTLIDTFTVGVMIYDLRLYINEIFAFAEPLT